MANPKIKSLREKVNKNNALVTKFFSDLGDNEPTREQVDQVKTWNKETEEAELELKELLGLDDIRTRAGERERELKDPSGRGLPQPRPGVVGEVKTPGQLFAENEQVRDYVKTLGHGQRTRVHTPSVQVKSLITGVSNDSAGALVVTDRKPILDQGTFMRPLTLRDLLTVGQTDSDLVEFVRMTSFDNNAAAVAEATATGGSSGTKPQSGMEWEKVEAAVKTIAHWVAATRRALDDASQLRTMIDQLLMYGLDEQLEEQALNGSGVGENFLGIRNTPGIGSQAYTTNKLTTLRKARTKVKTVGRATPTAYLMNPSDWEEIDLLQDAENRYYFGGPAVLGNPRVWGLPVVECEAMTAGYAMVAEWRLAVLWDRMQSVIMATDSHSDFFVRNLIAILAEMRAAFGVIRPAAFVEADLTA